MTERVAVPHVGVPGLRLIRSEFRKIFTTNAWWIFLLVSLPITGLALLGNSLEGSFFIDQARNPEPLEIPPGTPPEMAAEMQANYARRADLALQVVRAAGSIYTSGQFFGLVIVMLLGALVVTNEYQHQTVTATFLTTPRRARVVLGKLVAVVGLAGMFWLLTQAITLTTGLIFFDAKGVSNGLAEWPVQRAMLFNALAYLLWAIFGFGLGTLIRSQIGAMVTGLAIYILGLIGGIGAFALIREYLIKADWVLTAAVSSPTIATQVMISPEQLYEHAAPWWAGALVLFGWALLSGLIGVYLMRRRDVS